MYASPSAKGLLKDSLSRLHGTLQSRPNLIQDVPLLDDLVLEEVDRRVQMDSLELREFDRS